MRHQHFIDWMKALGMLLIVVGHTIGDPFNLYNMVSQPAYTKQLGVAFFVFIIGWGLANETSTSFKVVYNRIFQVYFYGLALALILSAIFLVIKGDIVESNYLPFFAGINVLFNFFPANPTTWYIGTYLHLLLFWWLFLKGKQIRLRHIAAAFIVETGIRCLLLWRGEDFVAYMLLPNWLTVFLLGMLCHEKRDLGFNTSALAIFAVWMFILAIWSSSGYLSFGTGFPFRISENQAEWNLIVRSTLVSVVYVVNTLLFFQLARRLPAFSWATFFARNTLIIFILHMPVLYALSPAIYSSIDTLWIKKLVLILILFVGIGFLSEFINRYIDVKSLRNRPWNAVTARLNRSILVGK